MAQDGKAHPVPARDGRFVTRIGAYRTEVAAHRLIAEEMRLLIRTHIT